MTALTWPASLVPSSVSFRTDPRSVSGGATLSGDEQTVSRDAGRWLASLQAIPVQTREQVLAFRALIMGLDGRAGTVLVPSFDDLRAPRLDPSYGVPQPPLIARLSSAAPARSASVSINMVSGKAPEPGLLFGLGNNLHSIISVVTKGKISVCRIRPLLRREFLVGEVVKFEGGVCEMRLASDDAGQLALELARFGRPSIDFVEA